MIGWRSPWLSLAQQEQWFRCPLGRFLLDFPIAQILSLVGYVQAAVKPRFHCYLLGSSRLLNLIKGAVMSDGEVVLDRALFFDAENAVELSAVRCGPMQLGLRSSRLLESPVVLRQIVRQERVCLIHALDPQKPHLSYQPILKGLKEPLYPAFGLG